ncbi:glycosyltransferase family 4 protein [Candidatus Poribacteria bacterium]|nr:glycosyltransferase family 4 protein [Candidatus Poribacteria bacterium]
MKFLLVVHRWGSEIVGGAEIHHRRLALDLVELGHEVEVWTTTAKEISPVAHWGVEWTEGYPSGRWIEEGLHVHRFPIQPCSRRVVGFVAKLLQPQMELEWRRAGFREGLSRLCSLTQAGGHAILLDGWHLPETAGDGSVARWTGPVSRVYLPEGTDVLRISGHAPKPATVRLVGGGAGQHVDKWFCITIPFVSEKNAERIVELRVRPAFRPWRDHRTLGVRVTQLECRPVSSGTFEAVSLWSDYRAAGRQRPEAWWDVLWRQAEARPAKAGKLFDWLRGPRSPALRRALRRPPEGFDAVIAANFPWAIIPMVARECPLPLFALPLWHLDDDYYYWPQYIAALRAARLVMANTQFSAERFFRPRGIAAEWVGPGVPVPSKPPAGFTAEAWKAGMGIEPDEAVVLTVCRKSPEKRYDLAASAVAILRAQGRRVRFVLAGPDADGRPLGVDAIHAGKLPDPELDAAYRSCDVFVLMSESESFGMVLAEAWMRGKPVIANEVCGPAASLIEPGVDGLLARDAASLAAAVAGLLDDPARACAMGRAGKKKAEREFVQRAATLRFLAAAERALGRND